MLSFHVKFVETDRWTTVKQYAADLLMLGHENMDPYQLNKLHKLTWVGTICYWLIFWLCLRTVVTTPRLTHSHTITPFDAPGKQTF